MKQSVSLTNIADGRAFPRIWGFALVTFVLLKTVASISDEGGKDKGMKAACNRIPTRMCAVP